MLSSTPRLSLPFIIAFLCSQTIFSQVLINEICSKNTSIIIDEDGHYSDWIELYNTSDESLNLAGYYLSDNPEVPQKWMFPTVNIEPHGFLLIFASDKDVFSEYLHTNFKLSKDGETILFSKPNGEVIETVELPPLAADESFGRQADGNLSFHYFSTPSPAASNNDNLTFQFAPQVTYSLANRFFDEPVFLSLSSELANYTIRYTTDGSVPNEASFLYENPIAIDATTCIRAICFAANFRPSAAATKTYFIGTHHQLPVVTLNTHPDNFWDWEEGILVDGPGKGTEWPYWGANYWLDKEVPVYFEYFDKNSHFEIGYEVGVKVHGGRGGRTKQQKTLRILAKNKYGKKVMDYPFFEDRTNTKYKRLILRNGSNDNNFAHFRDGMAQRMYIRAGLDVDGLAYDPVAVYLSGKYYGVLNLREKSDEYYLKYRYNIDIDKLDLLEEDTIILLGDDTIFNANYDFITQNDLRISTNFAQAASYFDLKGLIDYTIAQFAISNLNSYKGNIKYWREKKEGAKWRYLLFDLETGMGRYPWTTPDVNVIRGQLTGYQETNRHINILNSFLANENFRFDFINRYADMLNTLFRRENFIAEANYSLDLIADEMKTHFELYTWPGYDTWWNERLPPIFEYVDQRTAYAFQHLQDYFELSNPVELQLKTYPENAGTIRINTIQPDLPWDGIYFNGVPINLEITAKPGYQFSHWQSLKTITSKNTNTAILYNFEQDDEIVAYFEAKYSGLNLSVYPNLTSAGESITLSFLLDKIENVNIQLLDASGRLVQKIETVELNGGQHNRSIRFSSLVAGGYFISVETSKSKQVEKFVIY